MQRESDEALCGTRRTSGVCLRFCHFLPGEVVNDEGLSERAAADG